MTQPSHAVCAQDQPDIRARRPWPPDPRYLVGEDGSIVGPRGRELRPRVARHGYAQIQAGRGKTVLVHRVVCETFHGPAPLGTEVAHGNGIRTDNRAENLRWARRSDNHKDKARQGREPRGERHSQHELSDEAVRDIRSSAEPNAVLARRYDVDPSTISYARRGMTWTHIR